MNLLSILKKTLPEPARNTIRFCINSSYRSMILRKIARTIRRKKIAQAELVLRKNAGEYILSGPFQGLRYISDSVGSNWSPKLIGTYEKELWSIIESIVDHSYELIIDIGAAEGYYAVGLAYRIHKTKVICFDSEAKAHSLIQKFAKLNGVENKMELLGRCTPELLSILLSKQQKIVIICDVEGAEYTILDPQKVPLLLYTDILVELHHFIHPDIIAVFYNRFGETHVIKSIQTTTRKDNDFSLSINIPRKCILASMDEDRPCPMTWFWMKSKH